MTTPEIPAGWTIQPDLLGRIQKVAEHSFNWRVDYLEQVEAVLLAAREFGNELGAYRVGAPAPQAAAGPGGWRVRKLEWRKRRGDYKANTKVGTYCVGLVHTSFVALLRHVDHEQIVDTDIVRGVGPEDAKAAAQADYAARIASAIEPAGADVERLREALERVYWWINDVPEIGTRGAVTEMRAIEKALGYHPVRAALTTEGQSNG